MPDLTHSIPSKDIGFLRIVASLWGVELTSTDPVGAAAELAGVLCDASLIEEVVSTLPKDGRSALDALIAENGRMPWVAFVRRFGSVREMGAGKRDREQPHLHPNSATEVLWYRALLAKAFFDSEKGSQEFAYIPDDLLEALDFVGIVDKNGEEKNREIHHLEELIAEVLGRSASPKEKEFPILASDWILDDACTLLAAMRMGLEPPEMRIPAQITRNFLLVSGLISPSALNPEAVKSFLESPREKALAKLVGAWQASETFDELRQITGLAFEGGWNNQPLVTREFLLNLLEPVPDGQWWSLPAFVRDVKKKYPDYQRPAGDYDSWFIKRESDGVFLRGFEHWDEVDGALIRYFITGPLHWLGLVDLAAPEEGSLPTAFRSTQNVKSKAEDGKLNVSSQGKISVPRLTSRAARYQIARFCEWDEEKGDGYRYRVTPGSLKKAREQGLKTDHLLGLLRKHASAPIPPPFVRALQRWEINGTEARLETLAVLRVSKPEVLNELRSTKAERFLGEILGPTTVVVKSGAQSKVLAALAEIGLLADGEIDV